MYYSSTGLDNKYYWFQVQPNINILINKTRSDFERPDVNAEIIRRLKEKENQIQLFRVLISPDSEVPEQTKPTLIIVSPDYLKENGHFNKRTEEYIKSIATKKGNSDRIYKNTLLFLIGSELGYSELKDSIQDYLACMKIRKNTDPNWNRINGKI